MKRRRIAIMLALMLLVGGAFGLRYALDSDETCGNPKCPCPQPCKCGWPCGCTVGEDSAWQKFWWHTLSNKYAMTRPPGPR